MEVSESLWPHSNLCMQHPPKQTWREGYLANREQDLQDSRLGRSLTVTLPLALTLQQTEKGKKFCPELPIFAHLCPDLPIFARNCPVVPTLPKTPNKFCPDLPRFAQFCPDLPDFPQNCPVLRLAQNCLFRFVADHTTTYQFVHNFRTKARKAITG